MQHELSFFLVGKNPHGEMTCGIYLQEGNFINTGAHRITHQVHLCGYVVGRDWDSSEGFQAIIKGEND